jgi:hypothetical protein
MSETVQTPKFECVILNKLGIKLLVKEFFSFDSFAFMAESYKSRNL